MKTVKGNGYDILIGGGLLAEAGQRLAAYQGRQVCVISDSRVAPLYGETLLSSLRAAGLRPFLLTVPEGEGSKSATQLLRLYGLMAERQLNRNDLVVALGGGVVGDLAGFAAATYMRGIDYVQIPTTLLSQVDSSVGGKVAIDLPQGKNLAGTFYNPRLVLADIDVLSTLEPRQLAAGMAEVIKYACIKDTDFFAQLAAGDDHVEKVVYRCIQIKQNYVAKDPKDKACRAELNFGHTLGHALENALGYETLLHGEGVAIGMVAAARLSERLNLAPSGTADAIRDLLQRYLLPCKAPASDLDKVQRALALDKKGKGKLVLLTQIGKAVVRQVEDVDLAYLLEAAYE